MNNSYWTLKIDYNKKQVGDIKVGDTLHIKAPQMEAVCTIIGFDDSDIPIIRYDKVIYKSVDIAQKTKYGKNDLFKEGDFFAYPFSIAPEELNQGIDMESIKGFIWDDINEE